MDRCESYHRNKLNLGNKTSITLVKDAEDNEENMGTFNPVTDDEEEDESQVPEQDDVDCNGRSINGLDHNIVDTYINMGVCPPSTRGQRTLWEGHWSMPY